MQACELHELASAIDHRPPVGRSGDRDAPPPPELEQPLVAQGSQSAQHRVLVDPGDRREVLGRRQAVTGAGLATCDGPADLRRHLLVELEGVLSVDLDSQYGAMQNSSIETGIHKSPEVGSEPLDERELQAIIREARARTRRRRLRLTGLIAGALVMIGALWWGFGGDIGGAPETGEPGRASGAASSSTRSVDVCPTGPGNLDVYRTKNGVRVCSLEIEADLSPGWSQPVTRIQGMPGGGALLGVPTVTATFTNYPTRRAPFMSRPLPSGESIALMLLSGDPGEDPGRGRYAERNLERDNFTSGPVRGRFLEAETTIYRDGWRIGVAARAGRALSDTSLAEANAILDSITVTEHLGGR